MGPAFKAPGFTYYTCWQRPSVLSGPSTALATGLFILTTLFGTPAHATIQLSKTIVSERDSKTGFSQIAGIMMSEAGTLYLTDSGSGRLVGFHPSAAARSVDLAAPNGAFRNRLTGITGLGDSLIAVANAADDVIAVIDGAGKAQYVFGGAGKLDGQLRAPATVAYSSRGWFYVADRRLRPHINSSSATCAIERSKSTISRRLLRLAPARACVCHRSGLVNGDLPIAARWQLRGLRIP